MRLLFLTLALFIINKSLASEHILPDLPDGISIYNTENVEVRRYSINELENEFPQHIYPTKTSFLKEKSDLFKGPLLEYVIIKSDLGDFNSIKITAYDNYMTTISMEEIRLQKPIIALQSASGSNENDLQPISILEKGPTRLIWNLEQLKEAKKIFPDGYWIYSIATLRGAR